MILKYKAKLGMDIGCIRNGCDNKNVGAHAKKDNGHIDKD